MERSRLKVFENRVLRNIFWPKRDEVTGEWRKLHKRELNDLYYSPNLSDKIKNEMSWARSRYGGEEIFIQDFGGEPEGKRPLADLALDADNTKMDLQDV